MKRIKVNVSSSYDVTIGSGIIADAGTLISAVLPRCKVALVSDSNVMPIYGAAVEKSLINEGYSVYSFSIPAGESSKSFDKVSELLSFFSQNALSRSDIVVALGGGVIGDLAGFAASIFLRGIRYVQIPTSLLAAVDSSVGGKTGVDLPHGKNMAGSFWQPSAVICDTDTFETLSPHYLSDGLAEVVKYGIIADRTLFDRLKNETAATFYEDIVSTCVSIKRDIVEKDEFDQNERQLLNLGHTIGHAIEKLSGYRISHGHAISIGMVCMARACDSLGLCAEGSAGETEDLLVGLGLPTKSPFSAEQITKAAHHDKKIKGDAITLAIAEKIGHAVLHKIALDKLESFFKAGIS